MDNPLRLYNTLGRKIDEFEPLHDKQVGLYTCGPTVYSTAHIGNLRTYIFEDILRRTLEFNGYQVNHVMNVTDVGHLTSDADEGEDKMEKAARSEHRSALEIARQHEQEFFHDLELLNIEKPTKVIRATETIDWQINLIKQLEQKGVTYQTTDGIYFDTAKFPHYGQLSGQKLQDKKAGARIDVSSEKRHPTDFALWKFSKPEDKRQMEWPSPWGTGFPGWHIECSAMSMHELGQQFDIHCGGIDHIAVHHENEIAQSEAVTGQIPARWWMHGEFLVTDKRMGKSEGNSVTLDDVINKHNMFPLAYRYLVLQTHYRKPLSFSWTSLRSANKGLERFWAEIAREEILQSKDGKAHSAYVDSFTEAINDDLNTARALDFTHQLVQSSLSPADKKSTLELLDKVLGLNLLQVITNESNVTGNDDLIDKYTQARKEKRYQDSDKIRKQFTDMGLIVEDLPDGTSRLRKK